MPVDLALLAKREAELDAEIVAVNEEITRLENTQKEVERNAAEWKKKKFNQRKRLTIFLWWMGSAFALQGLARVTVAMSTYLGRFYDWFLGDGIGASVGRVVLLVVLGSLAYQFRKRQRRHYGAFEIGAAIATGTVILSEHRDGVVKTCALLGVIYFYVRGQDNYDRGHEEDSKALDARAAESQKLAEAVIAGHDAVVAGRRALPERVKALGEKLDELKHLVGAAKRDIALREAAELDKKGPPSDVKPDNVADV